MLSNVLKRSTELFRAECIEYHTRACELCSSNSMIAHKTVCTCVVKLGIRSAQKQLFYSTDVVTFLIFLFKPCFLREAATKVIFLGARPLRPSPPPPSSLVATFFGVIFRDFFRASKKIIFSYWPGHKKTTIFLRLP